MIDFIVEQKILSFALVTSVFTTALLMSLKNNIVEPVFEVAIPSYNLDIDGDGIPDVKVIDMKYFQQSKDRNDINELYKPPGIDKIKKSKQIKWKMFLKDFLIWLVIILVIYLLYSFLLVKKNNNNN